MSHSADLSNEMISQIALNLSSINIEFRKLAFSELTKIFSKIESTFYSKVSAGLFYYYWFSDGPENQSADRKSIVSLLDHLNDEQQLPWISAFIESIMKLWETIDHIRIDKYLSLIKECTFAIYTRFNGAESWKQNWANWNSFMSSVVIFDSLCSFIRCQFCARVAFPDSKDTPEI